MQIFLLVISTVFQHGSLYMQMHLHPESFSFGKYTVYRFMNSCHINWRRFTTLLASRIISQTIVPLTSNARKNVFIIDDSLFSRSRSKKVELLAKVFDHAHHVYTYGFRMLTLGWSDGNTFLPVNYCLLSTENAKNRIHEASNLIDPRTNGGRQRSCCSCWMKPLLRESRLSMSFLTRGSALRPCWWRSSRRAWIS